MKTTYNFTKKYVASLVAVLVCLSSCDGFLDTAPTGQLADAQIITNMDGLRAVLTGTYRSIRDGAGYGVNFYSPEGIMAVSSATSSDLMINDEQPGDLWFFTQFAVQRYDGTQPVPKNMWNAMYKIISNANVVIANIENVSGDEDEKGEIKGQALALRARCYFNLVRFYQHTYIIAKSHPGVPLYLEPSVEPLARATVEEVYQQIVSDLKEAEGLLANYSRPTKEYYNKDVVNFLLANVYLTMNNWSEGQKYANKIRTSYSLMSMDDYKAGFSTMNKEWVLGYVQTAQDYWWYDSHACWFDFGQNNAPWQAEMFIPVNYFVETIMKDDPRNLTIPNPLYEGKYAATKFLELRDAGPYGDLFDMRAAEMYLVEAECAARAGDVATAKSVLNQLQQERGAAVTTATTQADLINAVLLERRKEMWGEGLDFFDILRLQKPINNTTAMGFYFDISQPANSNKLIMMIPEKEMINNSLMVQNPDPSKVPVFVP